MSDRHLKLLRPYLIILQTRFTLPRESDSAAILVNSIIEWAKPLCYTSCGNYLCQQLLERGDVDDKLNFIDRIR